MKPQDDKLKPTPVSSRAAVQTIASPDLFRGGRRLEIEHQGEIYRLQITRQGKLILTK